MYVCLCNCVTDGQIKFAVEEGQVQTLGELNKKLGIAENCGKCLEEVRDIFHNSSNKKKSFPIELQKIPLN